MSYNFSRERRWICIFMHATLFVTVSKSHVKTNLAARKYVYKFLLNDEAFSGEDVAGNSAGVADWFVIGGQASGSLAVLSRPKGLYEALGSESDAAQVNAQLYKSVLAEFEGKAKADAAGDPVFRDLDNDPVSKETFLGKKW